MKRVARLRPAETSVALPLALVAAVATLDLLIHVVAPSASGTESLGLAALDDPAHLATAALVLLCLPASTRGFAIAFLVASVAIDLDHLPKELGSDFLTAGTARPYTHSLVGAVLLALVAFVASRRRDVAAGAGLGILAHLVRDVATGPGVPLAWPLSDGSARVPYVSYLTLVIVLGACAAITARRRRLRSVGRMS